jgi:hypothetical protein
MQSDMEVGGYLILGLFLLSVSGGLLWLIGHIWLLIQAFKESVGWGIALLVLPPLSDLLYSLDHWALAKKPFLLSVAGVLLLAASFSFPFLFPLVMKEHAPPPAEPEAVQAGPTRSLEQEAGIPSTDRERVADMLHLAGIDPENHQTFTGRTIADMTEALGPPSATMKVGKEVTYIFYNCFEVVSKDGGKTVSAAHYMGH